MRSVRKITKSKQIKNYIKINTGKEGKRERSIHGLRGVQDIPTGLEGHDNLHLEEVE